MKRIIGKYGKIVKGTTSCLKLDNIDYRLGGHEFSLVYAIDHVNGIVIRTDFFEVDDFKPFESLGRIFKSDYHDMVQKEIAMAVKRDKMVNDAEDSYSERNHP